MKIYKDDFGNRAEVITRKGIAYKGSTKKENGWVLSCFAEYDDDFMYYRSIFDNEKDLLRKLQEFSCGTFREVKTMNGFTNLVGDRKINMIKCGMDPTVPEDSDCANCCIYCNQKYYCDYTCPIVKESRTEDDILNSKCDFV